MHKGGPRPGIRYRPHAYSDHWRRRFRRLPSVGGPAGSRPRVFVLDDLSTGLIDNIAHLKARPGVNDTIDTVFNDSLTAELVDRADVVFHLAAAVGVKLVVERRSTRSRPTCTAPKWCCGTRTRRSARGRRLDLGGLRQERLRAVPRGRRPGAGGHQLAIAGPTRAARCSTSSWPSPTGRSTSSR